MKTLTDKDASVIDWTPAEATVEGCIAIPTNLIMADGSRGMAERFVWRIRAAVVGFKLEADSDLHVVIAGESGATMIIEFPSPTCTAGAASRAEMTRARDDFVKLFGQPTAKFKRLKQSVAVIVEGVGFFDKLHGQTGAAPNGIELHPVTRIELTK